MVISSRDLSGSPRRGKLISLKLPIFDESEILPVQVLAIQHTVSSVGSASCKVDNAHQIPQPPTSVKHSDQSSHLISVA